MVVNSLTMKKMKLKKTTVNLMIYLLGPIRSKFTLSFYNLQSDVKIINNGTACLKNVDNYLNTNIT